MKQKKPKTTTTQKRQEKGDGKQHQPRSEQTQDWCSYWKMSRSHASQKSYSAVVPGLRESFIMKHLHLKTEREREITRSLCVIHTSPLLGDSLGIAKFQ